MKLLLSLAFLITLTTVTVMTSCGVDNASQNIIAAENAYANNDYAESGKICMKIVANDSLADLSVKELCRLSILFMQLSEHCDEDVNVAMATRCYNRAIDINPDSAAVYYDTLFPDAQAALSLLNSLNKSLVSPRDIFINENGDSIYDATDKVIPHFH